MSDMRYFGKYLRFETESKKSGVFLMNADNLIGDEFSISFEVKNGKTTAWVVNKFQTKVGFLSERDAYQLEVIRARGWKIRAMLSIVLYTEQKPEGLYWGELAVVANPERYDAEIDAYMAKLKTQLLEGVRPAVDLTEAQIDTLMAQKGNWVSPDRVSAPKSGKNTAVIKTDQSIMEKIIEQGRSGNKGCYAISWIFIIVLVDALAGLLGMLFGLF